MGIFKLEGTEDAWLLGKWQYCHSNTVSNVVLKSPVWVSSNLDEGCPWIPTLLIVASGWAWWAWGAGLDFSLDLETHIHSWTQIFLCSYILMYIDSLLNHINQCF